MCVCTFQCESLRLASYLLLFKLGFISIRKRDCGDHLLMRSAVLVKLFSLQYNELQVAEKETAQLYLW